LEEILVYLPSSLRGSVPADLFLQEPEPTAAAPAPTVPASPAPVSPAPAETLPSTPKTAGAPPESVASESTGVAIP
jgi:hypothetical protein